MSKTVFILRLDKPKVRKPIVKAGGPIDDGKTYSRKHKHKKRVKSLLMEG